MLYILLRCIVFVLYVAGFFVVKFDLVNFYFAVSVYLLIFILHIVHWKRFEKEYKHDLGTLLIIDILIFGIIPIWEIKKRSANL